MKHYFRFIGYCLVAFMLSSARADSYVDFFRAVNSDDASAVGTLLTRGFDPNTADQKGQVALYLAMREDAPKVATLLLAHPQLKVDAVNGANETALMMAALKGRIDWARRLMERGAQVNREGWTPLHYAASGAEPAVVALLLDRGALIDAQAPNGNTALMMAALYGAQDSAELLLQRGANAGLRNKGGQSAADFARRADRERLAQKLEQAVR